MIRTILLLALLAVPVCAQTTQEKVREYRRANEHQLLREYTEFLSLPNVANDIDNIRRNAARIMEMMRQRGLNPRLLEGSSPSTPPAVYGEWKTPGAQRTLLFYAHYDGQPTDPKQWTGSQPWQPVLRSAALEAGGQIIPTPASGSPIDPQWRLYARSASDDKAGVMAILTAFAALQAKGVALNSNIKFFFEGEEEDGSPHLDEILKRHKGVLEADVWIICDGPVHQSGRKQVVFGVRGDTNVDVTVYAAKRPLHSGHYGNWSPNPAMLLTRLLATMKDDEGRVTIDGWYSDVEPLGEA
ncbi:MAG TPA: M20/M25/M40 family metallo-hydrolase, partial [Pyrinomonadaceae bacterium]|nr:M20/M25/M40 family metallo-hydrolase [Pyrinomonadaceae bacterium]